MPPPAIIDAWAVAYQQIADIFIGVEQQMYQQASWQGFAPFRVVEKNITGSDIAVFGVIPVNGDSQPAIDLDKLKLVAGQYITVKPNRAVVKIPHCAIIRLCQSTLVKACNLPCVAI